MTMAGKRCGVNEQEKHAIMHVERGHAPHKHHVEKLFSCYVVLPCAACFNLIGNADCPERSHLGPAAVGALY